MPVTNIIHYTLQEAATKAKITVREAEDYRKAVDKEIVKKLSSLPGSDGAGHISSALSLANEKLRGLNRKKESFGALCADMIELQEAASDADNKVKRKINNLAKPYADQQNVFQKCGSWLYEQFCSVEQLIKDGSLVGEMIVNCIDQTAGWISRAAESVSDWFRYGAGRYLAKKIASVTAFVGTVILTCTTVVALAFCPPLAIAALVAGTVAMIYTFGNMITVNSEMDKAERLEKEGKPGLARYYGETLGVKGWIDKTDFGGKMENLVSGVSGAAYDVTGKTAQTVLQALAVVATVTGFTNVYSANGKKVVGHDVSFENIKKNIRKKCMDAGLEMGKRRKKDNIVGINLSKFLFGEKWTSDKTGYNLSLNVVKTLNSVPGYVVSLFDGSADVIGNVEDFFELPLPEKVTAYPELLENIWGSMFMPKGVTGIGEAFGSNIFEGLATISDIPKEIGEEIKEMGEGIKEIREKIEKNPVIHKFREASRVIL